MKCSNNVFVFADKTSNIYELPKDTYNKLLNENITKTYKKAPPKLENAVNSEAKSIAEKLELADRVESLAKSPAYITLKDHKENFSTSPKCRLINPSKSELGKISKAKVEKINDSIKSQLNINQWKNTDQVITWFENIPNKSECSFIQFDIKEFYPSIFPKKP